ncbi:MAG: pyridoxal phosphate-dependent aminotransferase, partial [Planctomycetota bacterium]
VPRTGVIYVMTEARRRGYHPDDPQWANLGQGAPETGLLEGGGERVHTIALDDDVHEYTPVDGTPELKAAVAKLYNERYRKGKESQYTEANVSICSGGRLALARIVAALDRSNVGHFLPDYTAYEELLGAIGTFASIPILLDPARQYDFNSAELRDEILGRGLSAVLRSNPCNPTGKLIRGNHLAGWVDTCTELGCTLILDEFYSHYIYDREEPISAAAHVDDVNEDPVLILDGVTKNWRYPGWRLAWTVGPESIIQSIASVGSFLDGGAAHPIQKAVLPLVEIELANAEARAVRETFGPKRTQLMEGLEALGISVDFQPEGGFYCWGSVADLPEGYRTGTEFFRKALEAGVIVVPGRFFDINPGHRRPDRPSRFQNFVRFSFGPSADVIDRGLKQLGEMLSKS